MTTKAQVIKVLTKQGATWSERNDFGEYEFECVLPKHLIWEYGCGSFSQTRMPDETMAQFWSAAMEIIGTGVITAPEAL